MIAVIKYNAGNIQSLSYALDRLGIDYIVTDEAEKIQSADKVIFPGVGEASTTMAYLKAKRLDKIITALRQPVLGICLGMQLLCRHSEENNTDCLNIFPVDVKRFEDVPGYKVPHMGWNSLNNVKGFMPKEIETEQVYFVHSYYVPLNEYTIACCNHIHDFSAAMQKDNFYAVQFHPEKSATVGEKILKSFLTL
ncbi:MAG TPA: imidazole glycerol phosphate synthase subunit HisH [Cyclobacteriaceae bacterium]|nr:imidazole glycerol phosphate synthase subunit HisH [Cyclobacteriaceae bacterium]